MKRPFNRQIVDGVQDPSKPPPDPNGAITHIQRKPENFGPGQITDIGHVGANRPAAATARLPPGGGFEFHGDSQAICLEGLGPSWFLAFPNRIRHRR
ncbi:hypothetical protein PAF17_17540 [Paracoccus sp. Z330]|uniref:Uncharacterized protein n=1 Tax=Paracoccus onchidii TaxID=3017813 RepID=A0ABT4ZJR0_9RHOB|nr:hypothetical protein [Paracoccus onchidii]MDB6179297.1 hypothetical protein [Paracoccus onchidii]